MVQASEIRNAETLTRWLRGQPQSVSAWIGHRAALRLVPLGWRFSSEIRGRKIPTSLVMLRANLATMLSVGSGPRDFRPVLDWCVRYSDEAASSTRHHAQAGTTLATCAFIAARDAASSQGQGSAQVETAKRAVLAFVEGWVVPGIGLQKQIKPAIIDAGDAPWKVVRWDCEIATGRVDRAHVPLWANSNPLSQFWLNQRHHIGGNGGSEFWFSWYDNVLAGHEHNWAFLKSVALIPDNIWEQGAEAVATEIARIEEQQRLQREVERLRSELAGARSQIAAFSARGHNNPPELVEPVAEVERQADVLAAALGEAEQELAKEAPRAAVLQRIGRELFTAASKSLAYCASLGDAALKKAAEEVGSTGAKALIGAGLIAWVSQLGAVQVLARALEAFAKMLGGS